MPLRKFYSFCKERYPKDRLPDISSRIPRKSDIGKRVKLFWTVENQFFFGYVKDVKKTAWIIQYDDGDIRSSAEPGIGDIQWIS